MAQDQLMIVVKRKHKEKQVNIRALIDSLVYDAPLRQIELQCASGVKSNLRPMDLLPLLGLGLGDVLIHRSALLIKTDAGEFLTPFDVLKE